MWAKKGRKVAREEEKRGETESKEKLDSRIRAGNRVKGRQDRSEELRGSGEV